MNHLTYLTAIGLALLLVSSAAQAQGGYYADQPTPFSAVVSFKGGMVVTSARGTFPSLLVDSSTKKGSGDIPQQYAVSGSGSRWSLGCMIPFSPTLGLSLDLGSLVYSAKYSPPNMPVPTEFTAQTFQLGLGLEATPFSDAGSFSSGLGLRSVYIDGGFDFSLGTMRNRISSVKYTDTGSAALPVAATGHFENGDAFRTLISLRGAVGMRFAVSLHWELQVEAGYSLALNKVFSSDAIRSNDFTVDNLALQGGIGYRF